MSTLINAPNSAPNPVWSIVIVTHNQLGHTQRCLDSLRRNTPLSHEIIVVDNASRDSTPEYLRAQPDLTLIQNPQNRGFPAAANQGLHAARAPFLLLLNNDVIVPPRWLDRLHHALVSRPQVGLIGPCSNNISGPQQIAVPYSKNPDTDAIDAFAKSLATQNENQIQLVNRLVGFCLLFRREVLDRVGFLDERFGIGTFEDDDFCRRALAAGFQCAIAKDAFVHHVGSATFRAEQINLGSVLRTNQKLFEEKWPRAVAPTGVPAAPAILPPLPDTPRLSLCMIVRDSARTLAACLESIKPAVDEMIVVDTGSLDETPQIAQSYGAKLFHFAWPDSFADARNHSLSHATGDWIVWLDADDTISRQNAQKIRDLSRQQTAALGYVMQVVCPPTYPPSVSDPQSQTVVDHVKMFRNSPHIRFTGRIHEQILPSIRRLHGDVLWTDIQIIHSGSDQSPEGRAKKHQRDLRLLNLQLADDPDDSFTLFNLGMTLLDAGRPEDALNALARSLQLANPAESHCRKIHAFLAQAYGDLHRPATALKTTAAALERFPNDPELLFRHGNLQLSLNQFSQAEQTFRRLLAAPRDQHFSSRDPQITGFKAWQALAITLEKQSRPADAADAWRKALDLSPLNSRASLGLIDALTQLSDRLQLESLAIAVPSIFSTDACLIARSRALALAGSAVAAISLLSEAAGANPTDDIVDELCRRLFNSDDLLSAQHWLEVLVGRRPNDPSAHLNLAIIHLRQNHRPDAARHARRSLELRPNYPSAQQVLRSATEA